ncbi:MAG: GspE/PulE family protein [Chitinivibrionales bacterium]|nr:GspE/PulE family protein [Chitinivibrionales bacterium]
MKEPDLSSLSIPESVLSRIPSDCTFQFFVLPFSSSESGTISAYMANPFDAVALQSIQFISNATIKPFFAPREQLLPLIAKHYGMQKNIAGDQKTGMTTGSISFNGSQTVVALVDDIIHEAIKRSASDIHFEPFEHELCIRFRIDGVLHEIMQVPALKTLEVISRIKIMARMDIAEKRRSQDGRIRITKTGRDVDIRVSSLPTDFGEKIVLRLLDKNAFDYNLDSLGMDAKQLLLFKKAIHMPNGIVLLTGPTGSGKTTTLYGAINCIKKPDINISTVEDPIEYNIAGVNQTQARAEIGMTFARSLRTLLRQDPDVIMVGEMRDQETAEIAIRSSLTGHLVLSTLHTNDAASAVTRLIDMGIESYLVASSLKLIVAQRLVRKICSNCMCEDILTPEIKESIGLQPNVKLYKGLGCPQCGHTGYKGRTGVYEVLPISEQICNRINQKAYTSDIKNQALQEGLITLRDHALAKLTSGITSFEEVQREISVLS